LRSSVSGAQLKEDGSARLAQTASERPQNGREISLLLQPFVDIQMTDRQNVDIQYVDLKT
jgi:hypothetical protein